MAEDVDLFVIGGGSGGVRAARIAASHGARVALAEERDFGGTCVVRGCIPKKLFVYAAEFPHLFEDASGYGWTLSGARHDWNTLLANKDREIARLSGLYKKTLEQNGVLLHESRARISSPEKVEVSGKTVRARTILVATGGQTEIPDLPGAELAIGSDQAFHLPNLPRRISVVGGGYIGVEFAGIFAGLGCEVTLVHRGDKVLRGFDDDLRAHVTAGLSALGIHMRLQSEVTELAKQPDGSLSVKMKDGPAVGSDALLFATGRKPNTAGMGLEAAGVKLGSRGQILVDAYSKSNVDSIYAVGDCTDRMALTPVAIREGHAFADTVFGKKPTPIEHTLVPTAVFARPPAAAVGLTEAHARATLPAVDIYDASFRPLFHTLSGRDEKVFLKLVVNAASQKVLGVHMVGTAAPEIIQTVAIALRLGLDKNALDQVFALHPTTAEELVLMRKKRA